MRVVADTNILISALMFGGLPATFLELARPRGFTLVTSPILIDELQEKLLGKFNAPAQNVAGIRSKLESFADLVAPDFVLEVVPDDPDDNRVVECAVAGKADCIVSGDRHLLKLNSYEGIPILTVRVFLESSGIRF